MANILLVEDDPLVARMVEDLLEDLGHRIARAENGISGFEKFKIVPFDLVITDFQMPFGNGEYLIDMIRGFEDRSNTPILLMSGAFPRHISVEGMPIQGFLAKPFQNDALVALVMATLDEARHLPDIGLPCAY